MIKSQSSLLCSPAISVKQRKKLTKYISQPLILLRDPADSFFVRASLCLMLNKYMLVGYRDMHRIFDHTVNAGAYDSFSHTAGEIFLD